MGKHLHIVSFNVPYPADYGGVIDVFYRIKALSEAGVAIHLHCFQYGREKAEELEKLCASVNYYPRSRSLVYQFSCLPFIVKTRNAEALLDNLTADDFPILFEGLHSCYFLGHRKLAKRNKLVRCHNVEHHYYDGLAGKASNFKERFYFKLETGKLRRFEKILDHASHIVAISAADRDYFMSKYGKTLLMPPFHPGDEAQIKEGRGSFILYHGDLSTQENTEAVLFILKDIAPYINFPLKIVGKNPSLEILEKAAGIKHVEVIANPDHERMQQLVSDAQINLLPTFQATGFKLKLLNALFNGRFCVGTPQLVEGTGLEAACEIASDASGIKALLETLIKQDYSAAMIEKRKALLDQQTNSAYITELISLF